MGSEIYAPKQTLERSKLSTTIIMEKSKQVEEEEEEEDVDDPLGKNDRKRTQGRKNNGAIKELSKRNSFEESFGKKKGNDWSDIKTKADAKENARKEGNVNKMHERWFVRRDRGRGRGRGRRRKE